MSKVNKKLILEIAGQRAADRGVARTNTSRCTSTLVSCGRTESQRSPAPSRSGSSCDDEETRSIRTHGGEAVSSFQCGGGDVLYRRFSHQVSLTRATANICFILFFVFFLAGNKLGCWSDIRLYCSRSRDLPLSLVSISFCKAPAIRLC